MSTDVIANTNGIDVVLDGHSHNVIECQRVENKDEEKILLSSTGTKFQSFGLLYITKKGNISTGLIKEYSSKDDVTSTYIDSIQAQYKDKLENKIAHTDYNLTIIDPETNNRMVRQRETNIGDLCVDAFKNYMDSDIAIMNSGGVRDSIPVGDITYGQIINVMPFNNIYCEVSVKGDVIYKMLEMSCRLLPEEFGGFLQVSGITFEYDLNIPSPVIVSSKSIFESIDGEARVKNIKVNGQGLDENKAYKLASTSYILKSCGDGYSMFDGATILYGDDVLDNQVLIDYIQKDLNGTISNKYENVYGNNRIINVTK